MTFPTFSIREHVVNEGAHEMRLTPRPYDDAVTFFAREPRAALVEVFRDGVLVCTVRHTLHRGPKPAPVPVLPRGPFYLMGGE